MGIKMHHYISVSHCSHWLSFKSPFLTLLLLSIFLILFLCINMFWHTVLRMSDFVARRGWQVWRTSLRKCETSIIKKKKLHRCHTSPVGDCYGFSLIFLSQEKFKHHCCCWRSEWYPYSSCSTSLAWVFSFLLVTRKLLWQFCSFLVSIPSLPQQIRWHRRQKTFSSGGGCDRVLFSPCLKEMDNKHCSVIWVRKQPQIQINRFD